VTFVSWGSNEIACTYPKFQYVSELFINRITNASIKTENPDYTKITSYSFDYTSDFSNLTQIFSGMFAFDAKTWENVNNAILEMFGTTRLGWSLEVATLLASKELDLNVKNVECERVKESNTPTLGEKVTRISQIKDAFDCANVHLKYTSQYEKLQKLSRIQTEMISVIENMLADSSR